MIAGRAPQVYRSNSVREACCCAQETNRNAWASEVMSLPFIVNLSLTLSFHGLDGSAFHTFLGLIFFPMAMSTMSLVFVLGKILGMFSSFMRHLICAKTGRGGPQSFQEDRPYFLKQPYTGLKWSMAYIPPHFIIDCPGWACALLSGTAGLSTGS